MSLLYFRLVGIKDSCWLRVVSLLLFRVFIWWSILIVVLIVVILGGVGVWDKKWLILWIFIVFIVRYSCLRGIFLILGLGCLVICCLRFCV